jgi:HD-GYP domain-containing protein (c-di-GMP phosphodiesterase class II)
MMTEHEREARAAIRKLGISPAPMIELGAVISYINDGHHQRQYCEGVRDSLVSLARLKTKDDYTFMHSVAVCALMVALGRQIGMTDDECRVIGLAGLMHDIGKAFVPLEVLNKPARLTDAEFTIMRSHPVRGHELLMEGRGATPEMLDVVLHHHERPDGKGYPHKLSGDQLTRVARMGAICDVYDAITSNRPYKAGWDPAESIAQMASWKGQFDEPLFAAFVQSLGIYPTGSLVRLQSGKLAVVATASEPFVDTR